MMSRSSFGLLPFLLASASQVAGASAVTAGMFPPGKEVQMINAQVRAEVKWVISDGQKVKCQQQSSGNS